MGHVSGYIFLNYKKEYKKMYKANEILFFTSKLLNLLILYASQRLNKQESHCKNSGRC